MSSIPSSFVEELPSDGENDDSQRETDLLKQWKEDEEGEGVDMGAVTRLKERGNAAFQKGQYEEALRLYDTAVLRSEHKPLGEIKKESENDLPEDIAEARLSRSEKTKSESAAASETDIKDYTLTAQVYCNGGACCIKIGDREGAVERLTQAIHHDGSYGKAFLRRADCHWEMQQYASCHGDLTKCIELKVPLDAELKRRLDFSKQKMDEEMPEDDGSVKGLRQYVPWEVWNVHRYV